ncbi:hypothetical protein [Butyrivibrio sp. XBB1001]|uniref:hypothetical protein n=1 Tax=Butyrivibrio sp. XBB1001 TaxID=1280682 RepID=UPI00041B2DBB|nr:hypothetical protein [Butyrivibrio sp. XBB1001]
MIEKYYESRKEQLEKEIIELEARIAGYPSGTIVICEIKGKIRYYHQRKNKNGEVERKYINEKNRNLAVELAQKVFLKSVLCDKKNELGSIEQYLKTRYWTDYGKYLDENSRYRKLLASKRWDMEDYERNLSHPENLIVKAPKGEYVRSKSEALIANALFDAGIPYRYECKLDVGGDDIYPDFTVRIEKENKLVIWEHFGKMDDPEYVQNVIWKMRQYIKNGYYPGKNFLATYESKADPLTIDVVQKIIADNFM